MPSSLQLRDCAMRVSARLLATSTRAWRQKRSGDHWANLAVAENVRSRAAFKLIEINDKFGSFLRPGVNVVDLGAAPGGFSVVAAGLVKLREPQSGVPWEVRKEDVSDVQQKRVTKLNAHQKHRWYGRLVCVDLKEMEQLHGAKFVHGDMGDLLTQKAVRYALNGEEADVLLSDMAPNTSTDKLVSHFQSMRLARIALDAADSLLRSGGTLVVKIFRGPDEKEFRQEMSDRFVSVRAFDPKASRAKRSVESFLIGQKFVPKHMRIEHDTKNLLLDENEPAHPSVVLLREGRPRKSSGNW